MSGKTLVTADAKCNKDRRYDNLSDKEGRLGLRRRQWLKKRQLLERLYDCDEYIEIESPHGICWASKPDNACRY